MKDLTNDLPYTIDVRYNTSLEYVKQKSFFYRSFPFIIFWLLFFICFFMFFAIKNANAGNNEEEFLNKFPEKHTVIGCYNDRNNTTREGNICTNPGDHNIILPPREHIKKWLTVFNKNEVKNRLALVNFESSFNENAENEFAKGYVQTLKKWNISKEIIPQLQWMKNRQKYQKVVTTPSGSKRCGYYWENYNYKDGYEAGEYGVLSCLYRYHFHSQKGTWYAKRGILVTKFYKNYLQNK